MEKRREKRGERRERREERREERGEREKEPKELVQVTVFLKYKTADIITKTLLNVFATEKEN